MNPIALFLLLASIIAGRPAAAPLPATVQVAVGTARIVKPGGQLRKKLCDFAAHASQAQALPMANDPVFRPPTAESKAALGVVRKDLMTASEPTATASAERRLAELLNSAEGPSLARLALLDRNPTVQLAGIRAAVRLAAQHPRLFAFLPTLDAKTPPNLARAIVAFDFATQCDAPVLFSLDGLEHPDAGVVADLVDRTAALGAEFRDAAPVDRLVAWVMRRQGPVAVRARAVRALGELGLVHLNTAWQQLAGDANPEVAAEAWPAWARVAPGATQVSLNAGGFADPRPLLAWGALRAAADACALSPGACAKPVRAFLASKVSVTDPVTGERVELASLAQQVLNYWEGK